MIHNTCYTVPEKKDWMGRLVFREVFDEDRSIQPDVQESEQIIFLDTVSSHQTKNEFEGILHEMHTRLS